jgi:hypothetical protein
MVNFKGNATPKFASQASVNNLHSANVKDGDSLKYDASSC